MNHYKRSNVQIYFIIEMNQLPYISVIVPVFNGAKNISICIESLLAQTYPRERYEVVIVDNNSTDDTTSIVQKYPVKLLLEKDIQSSYAARNRGIEGARGEIFAFTDSDVKADSNWLKFGIEDMIQHDADYAGCRVELFSPRPKLTYCDMFELFFAFPMKKHVEQFHFASTVGLFVKKSVIEAAGAFDIQFISGGDVEFGTRVFDMGFRQSYSERAIVYHPTQSSLRQIIKRAIRYGRGEARLSSLFPERFGGVYSKITRLFLSRSPRPEIVDDRRDRIKLTASQRIIIYLIQYIDWFFHYGSMILYPLCKKDKLS